MILDKFNLKGKSGIVTGAGSGIGFGLATGLLQAGAKIAIAGRNLEKLEKAAEALRQYGGPVIPLQADIGKMEDIKNLVDNTVKEFGEIDFLFNNAGIIRRNSCEDFLESDWDDMLNINLKGPFFLAQVTKTMANDWAQYNIQVNAIGPGWVKTELTQALREDVQRNKEISGRIPMGRWADTLDLAGPAVFLASDASDYITGQTIFVDGGWLSA